MISDRTPEEKEILNSLNESPPKTLLQIEGPSFDKNSSLSQITIESPKVGYGNLTERAKEVRTSRLDCRYGNVLTPSRKLKNIRKKITNLNKNL